MDDRPGPPLRLSTTADLLKAVELGIVDRTEARSLLGFGVRRGRFAKLQPRELGKFTKGSGASKSDQVLPFNRFSSEAQEAMALAQEFARSEARESIGTLDMLVGILRNEGSRGCSVLKALGVDESRLPADLTVPAERSVLGIGPTVELKTVVERAFRAVEYPHPIGTEHLVMALVELDGTARAVLERLGVSDLKVRGELDRRDDSPDEG